MGESIRDERARPEESKSYSEQWALVPLVVDTICSVRQNRRVVKIGVVPLETL